MKWQEAKQIMGKNFIGPDELARIASKFNITPIKTVPVVPYNAQMLKKVSKEYLLILGVTKMADGKPLTLNTLRNFFGVDSVISEPCFYNQDWYVKEKFANTTTLKHKWYLIRKSVTKESCGMHPDAIEKKLKKNEQFPSAILSAFTFFAYYFLYDGMMLWKHNFIWCSDSDKNGDRIYTGCYQDRKNVNKNGFNIHRHLTIRSVYGAVIQID
jgi:hypothetical protein